MYQAGIENTKYLETQRFLTIMEYMTMINIEPPPIAQTNHSDSDERDFLLPKM